MTFYINKQSFEDQGKQSLLENMLLLFCSLISNLSIGGSLLEQNLQLELVLQVALTSLAKFQLPTFRPPQERVATDKGRVILHYATKASINLTLQCQHLLSVESQANSQMQQLTMETPPPT